MYDTEWSKQYLESKGTTKRENCMNEKQERYEYVLLHEQQMPAVFVLLLVA